VDFDPVNPSDDTHRHIFSLISLLAPDLITAPPSWLGHVPFAFWIVEAARPTTLVELGTHTGNSYSAFCQAVKVLGLPTVCFAVDTWEGDAQAGYYGDEIHRSLSAFHDPRYGAFSRLMRMTFDEAVARFDDGSIDLLHIDGLHTYEAARHDFETWRPKLSPRGVVLFHDVNVRKDDFGVWRLWEELSALHPHFTFLHSNGLGVLGVGEDVPEAVRRLFEIQRENGASLATTRRLFDRLGRLPIDDETIRRLRHEEVRLHAVIAELRETANVLNGEVVARDRRLSALMNSLSWKISAPVRAAGRLIRAAGRLHRDRAHRMRMTLVPTRDARRAGDHDESPESGPVFRLTSHRGVPPEGWCLITYRVPPGSFPPAALLYVDRGDGISETDVIRLPTGMTGAARRLVSIPPGVVGMRLDPTTDPASIELNSLIIRELGKLQLLAHMLVRHGRELPRLAGRLRRDGWRATKRRILRDLLSESRADDYATWIRVFDTLTDADFRAIRARVDALPARPRFSIVMPVHDMSERRLRETLDSLSAQIYPDWELRVVDDASTERRVSAVLSERAARDARIKVVRGPVDDDAAALGNAALESAEGDFVVLMDHDDVPPPHALHMFAEELARHPDADILYSDEDEIDEKGRRHDPHFKSDFNPDLLLGQNMISHLGVFRRSLLVDLGGFRAGFDGSRDYDLVLRAVEITTPGRIRHLPFILCHRRVLEPSAAAPLPRAIAAAHRALDEHLERAGVAAKAESVPTDPSLTRIRRRSPDPFPRVSLIVPTRDRVELLRGCVEGLRERTDYPDLEILIVDNNSENPATLAYLDSLKSDPRVRVLFHAGAFNFSALNNLAAAQAGGSVLGLINNDIEVVDPGWLREMVSHAVRPEVGAVGAKLRYADDTVQHAGVVIGIRGVAGHPHKGRPRSDFGYFGRLQLTQNLSCVTAACLLLRKAVFEEVGGLDAENLGVAFNDVDFCLRLREKGYLIVWTPFAELRHLESASRGSDTAPENVERFKREIAFMRSRWGGILTKDPYYNPNLTLDAEDFGLAFPPRVRKPWLSSTSNPTKEG